MNSFGEWDLLALREPASASEMERAVLDSPLVSAVMSMGRQQGWNDLDIYRTCIVLLHNYAAALLGRLTVEFLERPPAKNLTLEDESGNLVRFLRIAEDHPFVQLGRAIEETREGGDRVFSGDALRIVESQHPPTPWIPPREDTDNEDSSGD